MTYDKLGRRADAEAELAKIKAAGDGGAYSYAAIYAQWGGTAKALEWLETAMRLRNPRLQYAKTDPLMDPLRTEPRFQAIERALKFPNGLHPHGHAIIGVSPTRRAPSAASRGRRSGR